MRAFDMALVAFTAAVIAAPLALAAAWADAMNDKPWGYHATPASYVRVIALSLIAGALVWRVARRGSDPWEVVLWRCMGLGVVTATALTMTFCLWLPLVLPLVLDDTTLTWLDQ
jgi:uncharacterized membrane protein